MSQQEHDASPEYPIGRGYGQDYMRGGEVLGGYGYSERPEYAKPRGELDLGPSAPPGSQPSLAAPSDGSSDGSSPGSG